MSFTKAIVRLPDSNLLEGITTASLGLPDYNLALKQHRQYIDALQECGLAVTILPPAADFPDATFIEDVALCTPRCAIVTRPGAPSRRGETEGIREILARHFQYIENIQSPGTLEAGDVMMVDNHYFIGLSQRTNLAGAKQLINILEKYGMSGEAISLSEMLHLKTGLSYLEHNNLLVFGEFVDHPAFASYNCIEMDAEEAYAANSIWVNERVLTPAGFPKTSRKIASLGYEVIELDVSEFQKLDGGLSCLSLRF